MEAFISLLSKVPVWVLIVLASCSVVIGDYAAKTWSLGNASWWYWIALLGYLFSGIFYIPTLLREGLIVTSVAWSVLSIIGFLAVGFLIFKETLSPLQTAGVILGILSIVVLSIAD